MAILPVRSLLITVSLQLAPIWAQNLAISLHGYRKLYARLNQVCLPIEVSPAVRILQITRSSSPPAQAMRVHLWQSPRRQTITLPRNYTCSMGPARKASVLCSLEV